MSASQLGPTPAQITLMGHNIAARVGAAKMRKRRQVRLSIAAAVVAAGATLTAAGLGVAFAPAEVQGSTFSCYVDDNRGADFTAGRLLEELGTPEGAALVSAVTEACAYAYGHNGVVAPDPTVCELPDLRLAVFPNLERLDGAAFCTSLGLGRPTLD